MAIILEKILRKPLLLAVFICIFTFYSGFFSIPEKESAVILLKQNQINLIKGRIASSPVKISSGKYYSCTFELSESASEKAISSAKGKIKLFIPKDDVEALYPNGIRNNSAHNFEIGLRGSFEGSFNKGIFYASSCKSAFWPDTFFSRFSYLRALCRLQFKRMMYAWGHAGGLLLALLCGAREFTEESTRNAFKNAGLSHILALSGMHLSLFSGIANFTGKKSGSIKITYLLQILSISFFAWFAGFSPSLLRAFLCSSLTILFSITGISDIKTFDILCLSFLIQSAICPNHIHNAGFILSYAALGGITLFSSFFFRLLVGISPCLASSSLSTSASAQIFTAPVSLKIFGTFCPVGVIATSFVSPLVTLFIYSGLALILLSLLIPILQVPSGIFMNFLYTIIKNLVLFFSKAPVWRIN